MFEKIELAPPDPILGLTAAFREDPRPDKVNLGVGVFKDSAGNTPLLKCVHLAEKRLLEDATPKTYRPITGTPRYAKLVQELLFGREVGQSAQTPGGTGALRVAADLIHRHRPEARVLVSDPTWANHNKIFGAADLQVETYPYYDPATHGLSETALLAALEKTGPNDVVLLHGCCHNPTGVDPTPDQWKSILNILVETGATPLFDLAYQGFAVGLEEDAFPIRYAVDLFDEFLVANSFSKILGLYAERVGSLTYVSKDKEREARVFSQLKIAIRTNTSNAILHGGSIVETVLGDPELRSVWVKELDAMRARIAEMRNALVDELGAGFEFIRAQNGMFSFSGLNKAQVEKLRQEHAIYMVGCGRINVAGLNPGNLKKVCKAVSEAI